MRLTPEVKRRLAEVVHALRAGEPLQGQGDEVDIAAAKIIARRWREAERAGKRRTPAGSRRVQGWVGGRRVDAAIPAEVVEAAEIVDD